MDHGWPCILKKKKETTAADGSRLERNNNRRRVHQEAIAEWERERDLAKAEGRRAGWKRPVLGKLEGPLPRPVKDGDSGGDGDEEEGSGNESDSGSVEA